MARGGPSIAPVTQVERTPKKLLKPRPLSKNDTPARLNMWLQDFEIFFQSGSYNDMACQQAYFRLCLEDDLRSHIEPKIMSTMPVYGREGCIVLLKEEFAMFHPIIVRRMNYFQSQLGTDEADTCLERIVALSMEANVSEFLNDTEQLNIHMFMASIKDDRLREKLFDLKERNIANVRKLVSPHVSQKREETPLRDKVQVVTAVQQNMKQGFQGGDHSDQNHLRT